MFEVHNKIFTPTKEHADRLQAGFAHAGEHMKAVPGFKEFHMLKAADGSHFIVRVVWDSKEQFQAWTQSDHFKEAHRGQGDSSVKSELGTYEIVL